VLFAEFSPEILAEIYLRRLRTGNLPPEAIVLDFLQGFWASDQEFFLLACLTLLFFRLAGRTGKALGEAPDAFCVSRLAGMALQKPLSFPAQRDARDGEGALFFLFGFHQQKADPENASMTTAPGVSDARFARFALRVLRKIDQK